MTRLHPERINQASSVRPLTLGLVTRFRAGEQTKTAILDEACCSLAGGFSAHSGSAESIRQKNEKAAGCSRTNSKETLSSDARRGASVRHCDPPTWRPRG